MPRAQIERGGIGNLLTILLPDLNRQHRSVLVLSLKESDLLRRLYSDKSFLNEIRSFAVISPAKRFSAPAPTAWSHHENLSSLLSLFGLFLLCLCFVTLFSGVKLVSHENPPSIYMYCNVTSATLDLLFKLYKTNCEMEFAVSRLARVTTDDPLVRQPSWNEGQARPPDALQTRRTNNCCNGEPTMHFLHKSLWENPLCAK
jgi:hypothetical protein